MPLRTIIIKATRSGTASTVIIRRGASGTGTGGGVTDHGALAGLGDDDHPQYLNNTRGDARYGPIPYGGDDPNIPSLLTITGITTPAASDPIILPYTEISLDYPKWDDGSWRVEYGLVYGEWLVDEYYNGTYGAKVASTEYLPVGLEFPTPFSGAGILTITGNQPIATYLGQLCQTPSALWRWNGSAWVSATAANTIPLGNITQLGQNVRAALAIPANATGGIFRQGQALQATTLGLSGNATVGGMLIATGKVTGNGQGNLENFGDNDLLNRYHASYEAMMNGMNFRQLYNVTTTQAGTGASGSSQGPMGSSASIAVAVGSSASAGVYDSIHSHAGYSGSPMRSNAFFDFFAHGVMLRVEPNTNWVSRINFGVGSPNRTIPLAGEVVASSRQWGVEFYYDGAAYVGRLYWYDTSINYGTPFALTVTAANWSGLVYSMRMTQNANGKLDFYVNTPASGLGGGRLPTTPTSTVNAVWTNVNLNGRHINFEVAAAAAAAPTNGARIHASAMFCRYQSP